MLWFYADSQDAPKIKVWLLVVVTGLITQSFLAIFPFLSHLLHFLPLFPESTSQINYFPCIPVSGSSRAIQREYRYHCKCFRKCLLTPWRVAWRRDREEAPVVLVEIPWYGQPSLPHQRQLHKGMRLHHMLCLAIQVPGSCN